MAPYHPTWGLALAPTHWMDGGQPSKLADVFWGGIEDVYGPQSALLLRQWFFPQHWSVLRAVHTLNSPKNYIRLLGGLLTIHSMHWIGVQCLMWGTRGPFPPVVAMVCYGCVGRCWPLEADVRSAYCSNSNICLRKYYLYSYIDPIHSWHFTRRLKKEDLDRHILVFSWFLCPVF